MAEKITGAFTSRQNMIYKLLFGEDIPGFLPPTVEERLRTGLASRADSISAKLIPGAAAPSEYEKLLERLPPEARPKADSIKAGFLTRATAGREPSEKLQSLNRLIRSGLITETQRDSIVGGVKAGEEPPRTGLLQKSEQLLKDIASTEKLAATKITPYTKEELMAKIFTAKPEERLNLLSDFLAKSTTVFPPGSVGKGLSEKRTLAKQDSVAIIGRALDEKFSQLPSDTDINELLSAFPIAQKAMEEYTRLRKEGIAIGEARSIIGKNYGMSYDLLRKVHYAETGR